MKNPFPEYGDIKEITLDAEFSLQDIYDLDENCNFKEARHPHIYNLSIHYERYKATYQAFDIKKEQYEELHSDVFDNADLLIERKGWPHSLIWKDFKFHPTAIYEILYKENLNA